MIRGYLLSKLETQGCDKKMDMRPYKHAQRLRTSSNLIMMQKSSNINIGLNLNFYDSF